MHENNIDRIWHHVNRGYGISQVFFYGAKNAGDGEEVIVRDD